MTMTKKMLLVAVPTVALVLGGGIGIGLAATAGPSPTAPRPVTEQVLVTTAPASGHQDRSRDLDCDRPGVNAATRKASAPTHYGGTAQHGGATHYRDSRDHDHEVTHSGDSAHGD